MQIKKKTKKKVQKGVHTLHWFTFVVTCFPDMIQFKWLGLVRKHIRSQSF